MGGSVSCGTWTCWTLLVLLGSVCLQPRPGLAEPVIIKFATLAPDGTPWMNIMEEMNREVQEKSGGHVAFRFYAGGVAGDERDVIRKIRINQLHGGAFSGFGLGEVLPESRVLELPLLFRDGPEAEHVATALFEHFAAAFAQKHFVLLALNDAGSVYVFAKDPIRTKADMARSKIWTWQGDPLPQAIFKAYGIVPVPLSLAITNLMGAMVLSDALWQQLSADQQTLVRETIHKYNAKVVTNMQQYETKALTLLQTTAGIETIPVAEEEVTRLQQVSEQVRQEMIGKLYPQELLERVLALRDAYRQKQ